MNFDSVVPVLYFVVAVVLFETVNQLGVGYEEAFLSFFSKYSSFRAAFLKCGDLVPDRFAFERVSGADS